MKRLAAIGLVVGLLAGCGRTEPRWPADAGPRDAGPPDAGPPDAGPPDAGPPDAGPPDAGPPDAGPPDAGCSSPANRALAFALGQYARVLDAPSLHLQDFTIEAWASFSRLPTDTYATVVAKPFGAGTVDSFALWWADGELRAGTSGVADTAFIAFPWSPDLGTWHHLAFSYDHRSHAQALYLDGALVAVGAAPFDPSYDDHPFLIGADVDAFVLTGPFQGIIDEVRIWTTVRTPTQVPADRDRCAVGPTTGLAASFSFDEGAGLESADLSGNGNLAHLGDGPVSDATTPSWVDAVLP